MEAAMTIGSLLGLLSTVALSLAVPVAHSEPEGALRGSPEITATIPSSKDTCLTKEYLATGAVLFKDTCTRQWAINSTAVATHKPARRACLSKEATDNGVVIFRDTCTNEWGMNSAQPLADPPQ
jgi:hypothetical protein